MNNKIELKRDLKLTKIKINKRKNTKKNGRNIRIT